MARKNQPNSRDSYRTLLASALAKAKALKSPDGALARVADAYADAGSVDMAVDVVQLIEKPRRKIGQLLRIAAKCVEAGQAHHASTLVSLVFEDIKADQYDAYLKVEDLSELASFIHEKLDLPDMLLRITELAVELADGVTDPDEKARTMARLAVMTFSATAQRDKALQILSDAVRIAKTIQQPDDMNETLGLIANTFVEADLNDEALMLVNETGDVATISGTSVRIAAAYLKKGRTNEALAILRDTRSLANQITNVLESSWVLEKIALQYIEAGRYVEALEAANAIDVRSNRIEPAQRKAYVLVDVANKYVTSGQPELASQVLSQAFQTARAIGEVQDGALWSNQALEAVASKYAELEEYEQAFAALQAIEIRPPNPHVSAHLKSVGLAKLANTCVNTNKDFATSALSEALQTTNVIGDNQYCLLSSLARIAASYALLDKTVSYQVLSQLVELSVYDDIKPLTLVEVVKNYADVGQELDDTAMKTLEMMM
jgi:tetratricopeptide (TPR) repeat protein